MTSPQAVWVEYKLACDSGGHGAVAYTTFLAYWRKLAPQIRVMKPRTDLCWECQKNSRAIMRAANTPEAVKSEVYLISWALLINSPTNGSSPNGRGSVRCPPCCRYLSTAADAAGISGAWIIAVLYTAVWRRLGVPRLGMGLLQPFLSFLLYKLG